MGEPDRVADTELRKHCNLIWVTSPFSSAYTQEGIYVCYLPLAAQSSIQLPEILPES